MTDTLRFGEGIKASDISMRKEGTDLVFVHSNGTDQVTVKGVFNGANSSASALDYRNLERVEFADGT
ncbi:calcium-binding protein, partial [Pseudomonas oryzihabitans]|uniref:calcium-binding protein n=1 Tax=Pseudomonas oryzihabitans TaxID=47885 RepID=UPI002894A628